MTLLSAGLTACNTPDIYQDDSYNPPVYFGIHRVQKGETLYSIAWRYGRDYKELAAVNRIPPPYVIRPGQHINLEIPEGFRRDSTVGKVASSSSSSGGSTISKSPTRKSPTVSKPAQNAGNATSGYKNKHSATPARAPSSSSKLAWGWPSSGPIIDVYSTTGRINKGIDLSGAIGDPVYSAASGEVVYAGSGLLGYGQLIIINHNEQFLSAYAHNHRILVKEGDSVKAGQKIAEIGSSGTNRAKLHFEIRKDGQPVNPMNYLPKR